MADRINFEKPVNVSAQVGDKLYASQGGSLPILLGNITKVGDKHIIVNTIHHAGEAYSILYDLTDPFFMFQKDSVINTSSLLGYYADVKLVQDSTQKAELFSLGSEITLSSK